MASKEIATLGNASLIQLAAEGFLQLGVLNQDALRAALQRGNDNFSVFTPTQAAEFVARYELVAHVQNDPSGVSASLFRTRQPNPETGKIEYTLAIRSAEIAPNIEDGNDISAVFEGFVNGFSLAQFDSLDRTLENWRAGRGANGAPDPVLSDFSNFLASGGRLDITGSGIGGHVATLLARKYETSNLIGAVYEFNAFGTGLPGAGQSVVQILAKYREIYDDPYRAFGFTREQVNNP